MSAISFRSGGHDHIVHVAIGPDGYFYAAEWDGSRWGLASYAPPAYQSLPGLSPGVAHEHAPSGGDVLYSFVPTFDDTGRSSLYLHVRRGGAWTWENLQHLSVGRQFDTDCDALVATYDGPTGLYGAGADNRGKLLVPIVSHAFREIVDAGNPERPTQPALVRPKLLRVDDQLYAFVSSVVPTGGTGTLLAATNPGRGAWEWHRLGAPHDTSVVSPPGAVVFQRGTTHTIEAFVITSDGHLRSCARSTTSSQWHWLDRGKPPASLYKFAAPAPIAFTDPTTGAPRLYVFAFGEDRKLYACHLEGDHFTWSALGAPPNADLDIDITLGAASALRGSTRYVHAFVRLHLGTNNPRIYQCQWDGHAWSWHDVGALGLPARPNPSPAPPTAPAGQSFFFRISTRDLLSFCGIVRIEAADAASAKELAQTYCANCTVEQVDANATC